MVRHGRTAANASGLLQGRIDLPLDELGRRQVAAVAAALGPVTRVVSSPLTRARETAAAFGSEIEVDERWIELDYGDFDGRPAGEIDADTWTRWRSDLWFTPPGGESLAELTARVIPACEELLEDCRERDVVVVSHVSPIKAAVAWALGVGTEVSWRCHLDHASVCRITAGPRGPVLRSFNETVSVVST